jgi:hypothetical protein
MVEWIDLDELLDKSIGDIREMLAHEDSDSSFRTFLIENGWIVDEDNEYNDNYDEEEDDYEEDDDYEDDDCEDNDWDDEDDEEEDAFPSEEERALAYSIANDIDNNAYTIDSIRPFYSQDFIEKVENLLDYS